MPNPGPPLARTHLRLAGAPPVRRPAQSRAALLLRVMAVTALAMWLTLVAWIAATLALAPLLWRRAPLGRRVRPAAPREARVIPFQPRRQALPR